MEMTVREAAERLGVSVATVRRALKDGLLQGRKKTAGLRRSPFVVYTESVEKFARERELRP